MSPSTYGSTPPDTSTEEGGIKEKAQEKAQQATSRAREAGTQAAQAGKQMTQDAKEGAHEVMQEARQQGMQMAQEATQQFQALTTEATTQLREQATSQAERAAQQLRTFSDQARALSEGRTDEAGQLPMYAQQATEKLSGIAQRLENDGIDGVLSDARRFARRRPGTFLLLCGVAGFAAGRVLRGAQAAQSQDLARNQQQAGLQQQQTTFVTGGPASIDLTADDRRLTEARW